VVARLSLSYVPSLCLSSALSYCLCAVRVLCHMGLAACNKSSFVRSLVHTIMPQSKREATISCSQQQLRHTLYQTTRPNHTTAESTLKHCI